MNTRKVIHPKYLPHKITSPIYYTTIMILIIKVFNITGIWLGIFIAVIALDWIVELYAIAVDRYMLMFGDDIKIKSNAQLEYEQLLKKCYEEDKNAK